MNATVAFVESLSVSSPAPLSNGSLSAIAKLPIEGPWRVLKVGIVGDHQADLRYHGGEEKAIHHYPFEHYDLWKRELNIDLLCKFGRAAFGENLSTLGMTEETVCVGDIFQIGSVLLQISQARQPCWKLNFQFDINDMALRVQSTGRTGWYYRVIQEGLIHAGDAIVLKRRSQPHWPLSKLVEILFTKNLDPEILFAVASIDELSESWRRVAKARLDTRSIENWDKRLGT